MSAARRSRFACFVHAWHGIRVLVRTQTNARVHLVASIAVVATGLLLGVSREEWRWLVASIGAVWMAEAFNTALEFLADEVSLEQRERIGRSKDLAAAGVLCSAVGSAVIGALIFVPHLVAVLR